MLNTDKHRKVLFEILFDLFSQSCSHRIAFKGGTLCYFCYELPRFSTDIDLDICDGSGGDEELWSQLEKVFSRHGILKSTSDNRYMHNYYLSYETGAMQIKIEIRKQIWKNNLYVPTHLFGLTINGMERSCIATNKLCALSNRGYHRDLFDVHFFLKNDWPLNDDLIRERMSMERKDFFQSLKEMLQGKPPENILDGLGEVLDEKQKYWVKHDLVRELLGLLEFRAKFG